MAVVKRVLRRFIGFSMIIIRFSTDDVKTRFRWFRRDREELNDQTRTRRVPFGRRNASSAIHVFTYNGSFVVTTKRDGLRT